MRHLWIALLVTGCVSPEVAQQRRQEYIDTLSMLCANQGFKPDTAEHTKCALDLHARVQRSNAPPVYVAPPAIYQPPQRRGPTTTNCQRFGDQVNCTTW